VTTSHLILGLFGSLGTSEAILIGIVALLLFGNRLPEVMRSLGRGVVEFKKGLRDTQDEIERAVSEPPKPAAPTPAAPAPQLTTTTPSEDAARQKFLSGGSDGSTTGA
jgi:sec-independent protein translocase protein TatA